MLNTKIVWKKGIIVSWGTRIFLAFLYAYASLSVSLNHTCNLYSHKASDFHANSVNHCHENSDCTDIEPASGEIHLAGTLNTDSQYCAICHYSLLAKSSESIQKVLTVAIDVLSIIEIFPQLDYFKQSEHLSSISLRAPPNTFS